MKGKIFEKTDDLKLISTLKILQHTVNLNFSTETKCFYDINYVRKDLMC